MPAPDNDLTILPFADRMAWAAWLHEHHAEAPGVWLKFAKKSAGIATVTYEEAVEVALCFGWIDSLKKSFDDVWWLQRFTPRGTKSTWSKANRQKAETLIERGAMQPAGMHAVALAQADGRWDRAYDSQSTSVAPDDLLAELEQHPDAAAFFATLDSRNRYAISYRLQTAKKPETRASRIRQFVEMLANGQKLYP